MKINRQKRGSVLMEFIIVFPIYLVLFGGVFMIGDMAIKTTRLASADRTRSFDVAAKPPANTIDSTGWQAIEEYLFPSTVIQEDNVSEISYRYHVQGSGFLGPWTATVGAKAKDSYRLAPWTRGWLKFTNYFFEDTVGEGLNDGSMLSLLNDSRVAMFSKDEDKTREYNYYTYRRTRDYVDSELRKRYRAMPESLEDAGRLVDGVADNASWKRFVRKEAYPDVGDDTGNRRSDSMPSLASREYKRYRQYELWSE